MIGVNCLRVDMKDLLPNIVSHAVTNLLPKSLTQLINLLGERKDLYVESQSP